MMRAERQRLDKWLWFARVARSRAACQDLIAAGRIRINSQRVTAPGHGLKIGDVITAAAPHGTLVLRVRDLGDRRGDAASAARLFEAVDPA
jgi:ribosome-associated heat shock protein Hsp15